MTYTPSTPGHADMLERIARQHHEGASLEEIRKLVFQTYSLGYDAGVGEFFERQRTLTVDGLAAAAQTALGDEPTDRPEGVEPYDASAEDETAPTAVQYEYGPSGLHGPGILPHIRNAYVCTDDCDNSPCPAGIEHARCVPGCAVPRTEEPERTLTAVERTAMAALSPDELPDPIAGPHEHGYYRVAGLGYLPNDADCKTCCDLATEGYQLGLPSLPQLPAKWSEVPASAVDAYVGTPALPHWLTDSGGDPTSETDQLIEHIETAAEELS